MRRVRRLRGVLALLLALQAGSRTEQQVGVQDAEWSPDGRRVAVSYRDRIWALAPDGRQAAPTR